MRAKLSKAARARNRALALRGKAALLSAMLVIRRMDDGKRSYTAMFLPGEEPRIFPTTDQEHARILQIYKQDKAYEGICNDFTDFEIGRDAPTPSRPARAKRKR